MLLNSLGAPPVFFSSQLLSPVSASFSSKNIQFEPSFCSIFVFFLFSNHISSAECSWAVVLLFTKCLWEEKYKSNSEGVLRPISHNKSLRQLVDLHPQTPWYVWWAHQFDLNLRHLDWVWPATDIYAYHSRIFLLSLKVCLTFKVVYNMTISICYCK